MSFALGIVIIAFAFFLPSPTPTGIFWPALIVVIPSLLVGSYARFNIRWFSLGVILSSIIIAVVDFKRLGNMGPVIAILQIIPTFASIISFLFGRVMFAHIKTHNRMMK